ncbi:glucokinase [Ideonella sp. BN130291]|uniref:glucokinase n=1 Tax=Ideonella sp. BN130291 TaxID=3112940 RepID=UPI002E274736|nr:glucokinase [Ideonella sp. BN130291]
MPWLVADVGGTNARFGWVDGPDLKVRHVVTLPVAQYAGPAEAARAYLTQLAPLLGGPVQPPRMAAIAVATAVADDLVRFTNSHWRFSRRALQADLGLQTLLVLNDFEALALSLPKLDASQLRIQGELPQPRGTLAVIGPGTGLGVGGVVQTPHGWVAVSGEGGHATLAAADDFESQLLRWVRQEFPHVSAERLLSGIGLPVLHRAVAGVLDVAADPLPAEAVVERGLADRASVCGRTLDVFCALLGGFAGNVALTLGARGGVYIGGGIVPRLGDRFFESGFRERFEAKGRFRPYLAQIPTLVIIDTLAALTGATLAIEQHGR